MASKHEKSHMKRARHSVGDDTAESKKPRRSDRLSSQQHESDYPTHLPSPVTKGTSPKHAYADSKEGTVTPPEGRPSQLRHRTPASSPSIKGLTSPPSDTQPFSQFNYPAQGLTHEVQDEDAEGVWGYLIPLDSKFGDTLVLRQRSACQMPNNSPLENRDGKDHVNKKEYEKQEEKYEETKIKGIASGGYLIGRHPECDRILDVPTVSNRHCLLFKENKGEDVVAILEDLSGNGTYVNEAFVGRNKRRELQDGDEIAVLDEARFIFRYPQAKSSSGFRQQYAIQEQLGKGHFATVYLCVERASGMRYAVKKFERRKGPGARSQLEGLQQEIAVLMGVSHPNVVCLKDTFEESDGVYIVLELAAEGELFNWIVMKSKLSESEARKVFIQLFQGIKYLHERNIVHRDIKPENILLVDKELSVKLADFGLAKIIGEQSFTTTLCGTPSYVAPEILENSNQRRYTRAVDVWSLGVVLYICLCGFPPFSDELYSKENPYNLSQQIKMGRFDYPSPYWDPVSDMALDLIDRMLTVDEKARITIEDCLEHPWTTREETGVTDSTDGLTGAMDQLDFSKRKPQRERTLISTLNNVEVRQIAGETADLPAVKVFQKNPGQQAKSQAAGKENGGKKAARNNATANKAAAPNPNEFMQMGGAGDQQLFGDDASSIYPNQGTIKQNGADADADADA